MQPPLEAILGPSLVVLGHLLASLDHLGLTLGVIVLGPSWGPILAHLGTSFWNISDHFGALLGALWEPLVAICSHPKPSWAVLGQLGLKPLKKCPPVPHFCPAWGPQNMPKTFNVRVQFRASFLVPRGCVLGPKAWSKSK